MLDERENLVNGAESAVAPAPWIRYGNGPYAGGPAVARTLGLTRSTGELIKTLDADDQLLDGALARDIEILTTMPDVGWTACRALDLMEDGSTRSWENSDPAQGVKPRGWILDYQRQHDWLLPILPGTVCMRLSLVLAVGGWMALPSSEDTGLMVAANALAPGYFIREPGMLYRQHANQTTIQAHHVEPEARDLRRHLIAARGDALGRMADAGMMPTHFE